MKKDIILKDITKEAIREIFKHIIKIDISDFEFLDIEFQKIESRKADILVKANDKIIHVEFQTNNDKNMLFRMLRYYTEIQSRFKEDIYQYVIYIGKNKMNMKNNLNRHNINYSYDIIDMKKIDCEYFLNIDKAEALVVAVLCDFKGKDERLVIRQILERLLKLTKNENEFRECILMLEELSTSRNLKDIIKEEEMGLQDLRWEDLPSYEIVLEKGMARGIEQGINQGIERGIERGRKEALQNSIRIMLEMGIPLETIKEKLNLTNEELKDIL